MLFYVIIVRFQQNFDPTHQTPDLGVNKFSLGVYQAFNRIEDILVCDALVDAWFSNHTSEIILEPKSATRSDFLALVVLGKAISMIMKNAYSANSVAGF